jgi:hypothetical protein
LYASIYASCLSARAPIGAAELTAERICLDIQPWLKTKQEVTSTDIRWHAADHLVVYNPHAAVIYKKHRIIN